MFDPRRAWWCAPLLLIAACGGGKEEPQASPLDQIWGEPTTAAERRATELEVQELIATCMREDGWEYTPHDYYADDQINGTDAEDPALDPDYAKRYGYGVVHHYVTFELPYLDSEGNYVDDDVTEPAPDPNDAYVMALSESDRTEYYTALDGDASLYEVIDMSGGQLGTGAPSLEQQGCRGRAQFEIYGTSPLTDDELNDRYLELSDAIEDDPAIADAEAAWSDCLYDVDSHYDFVGPSDASGYVNGLLYAAQGLERRPIDPATGYVVGDDDGSEQVHAFEYSNDGAEFGYVGTPKRLTQQQIDGLQALELELWKVDQGCQDETGLKQLRRRREQELADTLLDEFPQYAAESGGGDG